MDISTRIELFSILGKLLHDSFQTPQINGFSQRLQNKIIQAEQKNPWFTKENIDFCLLYWANVLTKENLSHWTSKYQFGSKAKNIGIIMAGNIPLIGFHDLLCVIFSGNSAKIKLSSKDCVLLPFLMEELMELEPELKKHILFVEKLENFDAIIATGSDNTARYFEYYFKQKPSIIRKNRTSVAVLTGNESKQELIALSHDIFRYFGLGCRNVTKLFVPKEFDLQKIFEVFFAFNHLQYHHNYFNNYTYHRAIYLMNQDEFMENGFFMLKKDKSFFSPISCLFYEEYDSLKTLETHLVENQEQIQVVVAKKDVFSAFSTVDFGQTQQPKLDDYADGVDVMRFLENL